MSGPNGHVRGSAQGSAGKTCAARAPALTEEWLGQRWSTRHFRSRPTARVSSHRPAAVTMQRPREEISLKITPYGKPHFMLRIAPDATVASLRAAIPRASPALTGYFRILSHGTELHDDSIPLRSVPLSDGDGLVLLSAPPPKATPATTPGAAHSRVPYAPLNSQLPPEPLKPAVRPVATNSSR